MEVVGAAIKIMVDTVCNRSLPKFQPSSLSISYYLCFSEADKCWLIKTDKSLNKKSDGYLVFLHSFPSYGCALQIYDKYHSDLDLLIGDFHEPAQT